MLGFPETDLLAISFVSKRLAMMLLGFGHALDPYLLNIPAKVSRSVTPPDSRFIQAVHRHGAVVFMKIIHSIVKFLLKVYVVTSHKDPMIILLLYRFEQIALVNNNHILLDVIVDKINAPRV